MFADAERCARWLLQHFEPGEHIAVWAHNLPEWVLVEYGAALVGVTAAQGVQIVGALLVMSLLITPAAAAMRVFASPVATIVASVVFAEIAAVGGIVLSLAPGVPVSVFVTTISFAIYLVCWLIGRRDRSSVPA